MAEPGGKGTGARPSLDDLREAARAVVDATSLRHVAEVVEIGSDTLKRFLEGGNPLPQVRRKLDTWYPRRPWANEWRSLALLVDSLPEGRREEARREIIVLLRRHHERCGIKTPGWLETRKLDPADP